MLRGQLASTTTEISADPYEGMLLSYSHTAPFRKAPSHLNYDCSQYSRFDGLC